jgi:two-component system, NtrC family, nitrogen regulation response regulator NtrX
MKKILIIDDERAIRSTLKEILEFEKYKVEDAENGLEGLKKTIENNYDLIFCDVKMPKMDGVEFLEEKNKKGIDSPVIIISGHGNIETAVQALKKGAYDYIEKPLDLNRVLTAVRNAINNNDIVHENLKLKRKIKKSTKK